MVTNLPYLEGVPVFPLIPQLLKDQAWPPWTATITYGTGNPGAGLRVRNWAKKHSGNLPVEQEDWFKITTYSGFFLMEEGIPGFDYPGIPQMPHGAIGQIKFLDKAAKGTGMSEEITLSTYFAWNVRTTAAGTKLTFPNSYALNAYAIVRLMEAWHQRKAQLDK